MVSSYHGYQVRALASTKEKVVQAEGVLSVCAQALANVQCDLSQAVKTQIKGRLDVRVVNFVLGKKGWDKHSSVEQLGHMFFSKNWQRWRQLAFGVPSSKRPHG